MPAVDFNATGTPTDIVAALSLSQGERYTGQNVSNTATLFVREATAAPAVTDRAFRVQSGGTFTLRPSGEPVWLWTDEADGCPVILAEAA